MPNYRITEILEHSIDSDNILPFLYTHFVDSPHELGFRGHRSSTWSLAPSLTRFQQRLNRSRKHGNIQEYTDFLKKFELLFRRNLLLNNDITMNDLKDLNIWEYGQHYGLPTPLLDWSDSAYVALFFSLQGDADTESREPEPRALWVLNLSLLSVLNNQIQDYIWPRFEERITPREALESQFPLMEIVRSADSFNRRLAFQQGFFTRHTYYNSFEVWTKIIADELPHPYWDTPLLQKYVFSSNSEVRGRLLRALDRMNINSRVLFPDIKGSVEHTCNQVEFEEKKGTLQFSASLNKSSF